MSHAFGHVYASLGSFIQKQARATDPMTRKRYNIGAEVSTAAAEILIGRALLEKQYNGKYPEHDPLLPEYEEKEVLENLLELHRFRMESLPPNARLGSVVADPPHQEVRDYLWDRLTDKRGSVEESFKGSPKARFPANAVIPAWLAALPDEEKGRFYWAYKVQDEGEKARADEKRCLPHPYFKEYFDVSAALVVHMMKDFQDSEDLKRCWEDKLDKYLVTRDGAYLKAPIYHQPEDELPCPQEAQELEDNAIVLENLRGTSAEAGERRRPKPKGNRADRPGRGKLDVAHKSSIMARVKESQIHSRIKAELQRQEKLEDQQGETSGASESSSKGSGTSTTPSIRALESLLFGADEFEECAGWCPTAEIADWNHALRHGVVSAHQHITIRKVMNIVQYPIYISCKF